MPDLPELPKLDANTRITGTDRKKLSALLVRHYKAGITCREIGEKIGRSYGFVNALLVEGGANIRPRGGTQVTGSGAGDPSVIPEAQKAAAAKGRAKAAAPVNEAVPIREGLKERRERKAREAKVIAPPPPVKRTRKAAGTPLGKPSSGRGKVAAARATKRGAVSKATATP